MLDIISQILMKPGVKNGTNVLKQPQMEKNTQLNHNKSISTALLSFCFNLSIQICKNIGVKHIITSCFGFTQLGPQPIYTALF